MEDLIFAGLEYGNSIEVKVMELVRALYGLKSSLAIWRKISKDQILIFLGFTPSTIDPDMYYRHTAKEGGTDYYYLLLV